MLREIISIWKRQGVMLKAVETFGTMLENAEYVFNRSWEVFAGELKADDETEVIHQKDKAVNKGEREIRRLLVEHLTINPGQDVSGCLALMNMAKDAERIGDYAKNIFDLSTLVAGKNEKLRHMDSILPIQKRIAVNLHRVRQAFLDSDEAVSKELLQEYQDIKKDVNAILHGLFDEQMPTPEALTTVLLCRYLKRINSHISNVASGIIFPIDKIDFVRGGLLE